MSLRHVLLTSAAATILAAGLVPAPVFGATSTLYEVPATIDATGATDVTASLTAFISGVPDNSTVRFPAGGLFRIDGTLRFQGQNNLTIDGNGATTFASTTGDRTRSHWRFLKGSNIVVRNLIIRGANPDGGTGDAAYVASLEAQHGIELTGVQGVEIDSVTITDVYGDFLYLGAFMASTGNTWTTGVQVHGSRFERNGRQGIAFTGADDVEIYDNYIGNTRRATLDFEPNGAGWGVTNVSIHDNIFGPGRLNFVAAVGNGPVNEIEVRNNQLIGRGMLMSWMTPSFQRRHGLTIIGNVADTAYGNNGGAPISVARYDDVVIKGNVQRVQAGRAMAGIDVWESCELDISNNTFVNAVADTRVRDFACRLGSPWTLPTTLPGAPSGPIYTPPPPPATSTTTPVLGSTPAPSVIADPTPTSATTSPSHSQPSAGRAASAVRNFDVREPARRGTWLHMTGRVVTQAAGTSWTKTGGARVLVQFRPRNAGTYKTVGGATSRWNGRFTIDELIRAKRTGTWRIVVPASRAVTRSYSKPDFVEIR